MACRYSLSIACSCFEWSSNLAKHLWDVLIWLPCPDPTEIGTLQVQGTQKQHRFRAQTSDLRTGPYWMRSDHYRWCKVANSCIYRHQNRLYYTSQLWSPFSCHFFIQLVRSNSSGPCIWSTSISQRILFRLKDLAFAWLDTSSFRVCFASCVYCYVILKVGKEKPPSKLCALSPIVHSRYGWKDCLFLPCPLWVNYQKFRSFENFCLAVHNSKSMRMHCVRLI